jgi:hypothetical protein
LHILDREGILKDIVIIGRWCVYFYQKSLSAPEASAFRTKDVDILLPRRLAGTSNLSRSLVESGFVIETDSIGEHSLYRHQDLDLEFLTCERGEGSMRPVKFRGHGISALALRYVEFLLENTMAVNISGLSVKIPRPEAYLLHKLLIVRGRKEKMESDIETINSLIVLINNRVEMKNGLVKLYFSFPRGWRRTIDGNSNDFAPEFAALIKLS